jgi:serine/threonine-protein kinase
MKKIGKYIVRGLLGRGGMGKVYRVEHPSIGKVAALKLLDPDPLIVSLLGMQKLRNMFTAEAITLAGLRHPNIVEILDFVETNDRLFYLMAYHVNNLGILIGESSHPDEPSRRVRVEKTIHYTQQTLQGLRCLHHAGIIHRDIKPYNLLITDQDTVKICDFGLSKLRGEKFSGPPTLKMGSAWYAPPEQEDDPDHVDATADLYAVGVIFYRLLTGILPSHPYRSVLDFNLDLDPTWDFFILRAIARDVHARFDTAEEMVNNLGKLDRSWQDRKNKYCLSPFFSTERLQDKKRLESGPLRKEPIKVAPSSAQKLFEVDHLWRPKVYWVNDFQTFAENTIIDTTSKLMWQKAGSAFPLDWRNAKTYIEKINSEGFVGYTDWRLPTIAELMTLLTELPTGGDHCIEPIFDQEQKWIWSCDRRSFTAAWYVSTDLGFVAWQDFSAYFYVRAVRSVPLNTAC